MERGMGFFESRLRRRRRVGSEILDSKAKSTVLKAVARHLTLLSLLLMGLDSR